MTSVSQDVSSVLREEICFSTPKGQVVPQGKMEEGFYSRYFLLPKKRGLVPDSGFTAV